jgi:hypothetical protein
MSRCLLASLCCLTLAGCAGDEPGLELLDGAPVTPTPDATPAIDAKPSQTALELRGTYELATAGDVAALPERNLVVVSEWFAGAISLIDITDPTAPSLHSRIEGIDYSSDVQIKGDHLYVNFEPVEKGATPTFGIRIFDISDLANPIPVATVGEAAGHPGLVSCHNLWPQPDRELLYCASTFTGEVIILSTGEGGGGTRDAPVFVSALKAPGNECLMPHDMYARGNRLYVAWLCDGFAVYDITAPSIPVRMGMHNYDQSFTHNIWPTEDDAYVLTTDEYVSGHVRVWDIRDPLAIEQVAEFAPAPDAAIHNVEVVGTTAYISHYTVGTYVVDISDPRAPVQIGHDDFYDGPDPMPGDPFSGFRGAWGVEPAPPFVFVSGMESGLHVYELVTRELSDAQ